ncbi:MAG: lysylphosphatidylglycerol synthase transmembrane domain-containing protein [Candidatus Omnitrophica bacterium]|nr:lysylphosphatidylglycerol synthase transmembrane domain-containing protein [Candidatus Omnitrophota bacterium]
MKVIFKKIFSILSRVAISAALLFFVFRQVDEKALLGTLKNVNLPLLVLAFLIFFLVYLLCIFRWQMLLKALGIHLPLKRVIISASGGYFFSLFLPSTIGGDLMRSIDLAAHTKKTHEVIATVVLDRLSGFVGLVLLALLSLLFGWRYTQDKSVLLSIGMITLVLVGILFTIFNSFVYSKISKLLRSPGAGKIRQLLTDLHDELHYFKHHKKVIVYNLFFSVLVQIMPPLSFYAAALALGLKINIIYFFVFLPIIGAITLLPISLGGLGLRDATTIYFFAQIGVSRDLAFAMSLLNFFFVLIYGIIGGLIYALTVRHRRIQHHQPSQLHPGRK